MPNLIDIDDGENRAVRAFLTAYGTPGLMVIDMKRHMERSGFPLWPAWVADPVTPETAHLTKAGAQAWLRYLFRLESVSPAQPMTPEHAQQAFGHVGSAAGVTGTLKENGNA
jgi:hypothetical protein